MANWCDTEYTFIGGNDDLIALHSLLKELEIKCKKKDAEAGWDGCWLGNIVEALGKNPEGIPCRGSYSDLLLGDTKLTFRTYSAWNHCNGIMDLICEKFDSVRYFYRAEEPGAGNYSTNDANHKYYEPYKLEVWDREDNYYEEYFRTEDEIVKFLNEKEGIDIHDIDEIPGISEKWQEENDDAYIHVAEFDVLSSAEEDLIKAFTTAIWQERFQ